jgi:alpha-amylase
MLRRRIDHPFSARISRHSLHCLSAAVLMALSTSAHAYDISQPAILEDFENTDTTLINRAADIFAAGYGSMWLPPPGRSDSAAANKSVGYDVYDRFDLGSPGNPTTYGTQAGLERTISTIHAFGGNAYVDLVWNHSGFRSNATSGFSAQGGYPGFAVTLQSTNPANPGYNTLGYNNADGDYHAASDGSTDGQRISGLDDIAQAINVPHAGAAADVQGNDYKFIRQPTTVGNPNNIPAGTVANIPNVANAQYYPDLSQTPIIVNDPALGLTNVKIYPFNNASPMSGDPVVENNTAYLQRYAQWMIQVIGADGFRVDAAKNMPSDLMNYLDEAVYDQSNRTLLNGQKETVFSFQEVFDGSASTLQPYVLKNINPATPNVVGGDRDVLDFPLYFAMQTYLSSSGSIASGTNDWNSVVDASIDHADDGKHNGSQGVMFVQSADSGPPSLDNVAYAYTLMMPGNAIVYTNGHEFGTEAQRSFPQDGRGDALGGTYGTKITTLVDLRDRYGRGNYKQAYIDKNSYAFERQGSALVLLSNVTDAGYDAETIPVHFAAGTPLVELTGNAHNATSDPNNDIPQTLIVNNDLSSSTGLSVNARFLRNATAAGTTGRGYLIYGLATPVGTMTLSNTQAIGLPGTVPNSGDSNIALENGTDRVTSISVIKSATFQVTLNTTQSNLINYGHDQDADGDLAMLKIDGGIDVSGSGFVTDPTNVAYGFDNFVTTNSPGYNANSGAGGNGTYVQTINTAQLGQGYHYITAIAFRHNDLAIGGLTDISALSLPSVYMDWRQTIYIDTAPAVSGVVSFLPTSGASANRTLLVDSIDQLASNTHIFLDLPFGETDAQVTALTTGQPTQTDVNLWQKAFTNIGSGNHTVTIVSYKPDGSSGVQRFSSKQFPGLAVTTTLGVGAGDLNFDGVINATDVNLFTPVAQSNNTQFNAAADINGDGVVDLSDTFLYGPILVAHNSSLTAYNAFIHSTYATNGTYNVSGTNVILDDTAGTTNALTGSSLTTTDVRGTTLSLVAGATVTIAPNASKANGISVISHLNFAGSTNAWGGKLDLTNNNLILKAGGTTGLTNITNQLQSGHGGAGTYWNGTNGIVSSSAAADSSFLTTLGVILNNNGDPINPQPLYTTFNSQATALNDVLVKFTYYGDADLNGMVNGADYALIDSGFGSTLTGWSNGDFNYDGVIDGTDYSLIDNTFNQISATNAQPLATMGMIVIPQAISTSEVPEPGTLGLLGLGIATTLNRRRRR